MAWALEAGDAEIAQRTAAALAWFWIVRRHVTEAVEWYDRVLAANPGDTHARAWALVHAGFVSSLASDLEVCLVRVREGLAQFVTLGDEQGVKAAQTYEALLLWYQRDLEASGHRFAEIQEVLRTYGFEWGDAFCGWFLGSVAWFGGELTSAFEHNIRSLEMFRRVGDLALIAWTVIRLGNIALESNDLDQATALYNECLPMMDDLRDRHGAGAVLLGLGMAAHFRGEMDEAQRFLTDAQTILREGGGGQGLSWPLSNVLVDTHTHDLLVEATQRYQASLSPPPAEWTRMVCSDGEAWRARTRSNL